MEFRVCFKKIIDIVENATVISLQNKEDLLRSIVNMEESLPGDGDKITTDLCGRMVHGLLGNKLNRIELVVKSSVLEPQDKENIIDLIEQTRFSAGRQMIEKDKEIASQIRQSFL